MPPPSGGTTSVQVAVRIRPPTSQDTITIPARFQRTVIQATSATSVQVDATQSAPTVATANTGIQASSAGPTKKQTFTFDQVLPPSTSQHALFQSTAEPLISRFLQGFNCTILAYGQTSSGKTYSMTGVDLDADPTDPHNGMGIIPRAVSKIFQRAKEIKEGRTGAWSYSVKGSFIEIYNEDLIDLLGDESVKREVLIREDKDGHIIWGGLREVNVRNAAEVMNLLRQGTSLRRTNETDMNAQSSRSHAIFSITLTQKKYTGSGHPPRSSSPLPPGGRSPSRLTRPGSFYSSGTARVSSPTFGRPPTPSFHSAISRGGSLRPSSAMAGRISPLPGGRDDEEVGEWVTIVSKFHFVDLAGSERLKRTGGAGDRIKEGISINSGLLALGNVISALGDPARAKSHTASHVPYRDSKLTRLLQDSLGGNAHTLMIACVSPAEWNVGETVNTLKYANRARNIRNRAVVNEKEDGWDDVEWLQNMVTRLRKDLKSIKDGTAAAIVPNASTNEQELDGTSRMVMQQFVELQSQHDELRQQFTQRTEELIRLRRELGERQRASGGSIAGTGKYEEIVGPVIEEYEKTIAAMEAELSLNRVALRHTNDLVSEKEEELAVVRERHGATELYLEELRARVAKLTDREASTEAYIRDLEEKVKVYDDTRMSSNSSVSDLRREIQQYKDNESHSAQYIADLERRLSRSDESILTLREQVQRLENDVEDRVQAAELLQRRLDELTTDGQAWRSDLEEREAKLKVLERQLVAWEEKKQQVGEERDRLGGVANGVAEARRTLEVDIASAKGADSLADTDPDLKVSDQLSALQQTHQATLADLSIVTDKYRDALREISDLAAQIQEAKLQSATGSEPSDDTPESTAPSRLRRRMTAGSTTLRLSRGDIWHGQSTTPGRRLFFRQAASTESLYARSRSQSQSLSQELSSARSPRPSLNGTPRPDSLFVVSSSPTLLSPPLSRPNLSLQVPESPVGERSAASLQKEIMRLQEVLKEREAEISTLEQSLRERNSNSVTAAEETLLDSDTEEKDIDVEKVKDLSPQILKQFKDLRRMSGRISATVNATVDSSDTLSRLNELMLSMAQKESHHREVVDKLNTELGQIRRQHEELNALSRDQALNMSTELDALRKEHLVTASDLEELRLRHAEATTELEDQRKSHASATAILEELRVREFSLLKDLRTAEEAHASEIERLWNQHEQALRAKEAKFDSLLGEMRSEHEKDLQGLRVDIADAAALLARTQHQHQEAFGKLRADHILELEQQSKRVEEFLGQSKSEQAESLSKLQAENAQVLRQEIEQANSELQAVREEHASMLEVVRSQHTEQLRQREAHMTSTLDRLREEHAEQLRQREAHMTSTLNRVREEHTSELQEVELAKERLLGEAESRHLHAAQLLREEHAAAMASKEQVHTLSMDNVIQDHNNHRADLEREHAAASERLRYEHDSALAKLAVDKASDTARLLTDLEKLKAEYAALVSEHAQDIEVAVQSEKERQAMIIQDLQREHRDALTSNETQHAEALARAATAHAEEQLALAESHTEANMQLKSQHQAELKAADEALIAAEEQHRRILEDTRQQNEVLLAEVHEKHAVNLAEIRQAHDQERETLTKNHEALVQEVASYKSAMDAFIVGQEQTRELHEKMVEKTLQLASLKEELVSEKELHAKTTLTVEALKPELDQARIQNAELSKRTSQLESLVHDLDRHRSLLGETQINLQKTRDERDNLAAEKHRQDEILRQLQSQLESQSPARVLDSNSSIVRPALDRGPLTRTNGIPPAKAPPLSPPPSGPPPPTPGSLPRLTGDTGHSRSSATISSSSRTSQTDSPTTSTVATAASPLVAGNPSIDHKTSTLIEEQARQIEEQESMIKTLNKQLTHCEGDLQAHMDLVSTLETQLNDSERTLRKSRMQATEISKERDRLNGQVESLRNELQDAKREVVTVRRSVVEEKQSLEHRLDEERKAKERARAQLDTRMEELQKRKSKFVCM